MFDQVTLTPRTMIEPSLSADAHRGNERREATRVTYEVGRQTRGRRVGSIDTIAVCVDTNAVSESTYQLERGGQWDIAPIAPWLGTPDGVRDSQNLDPSVEVGGHHFQNGDARAMLFGVSYPIVDINQVMTLQSGDVIATATPAGGGADKGPPLFARWADHTIWYSGVWGSAAAHRSFDRTAGARL